MTSAVPLRPMWIAPLKGRPSMSALTQNLKFAFRQLNRYPGFAATVILTLALSIGANTAIFSIVNALLLKSLPYSHPERMGTIYTRVKGPQPWDDRHHLDGEQWELLRDNVSALISAISGIGASGVNLESGSHVQYVRSRLQVYPRGSDTRNRRDQS